MDGWIYYAVIAIVLWGVVGLLQKLGTNRVSAHSLLVWLTVGFVLMLPWFMRQPGLLSIAPRDIVVGVIAGFVNGLGSWFLFAALEVGAKASVAVPLTALYPLVTVIFATVFLAERLNPLQWLGVVLALIGGAMLSYETESPAQSLK